MAPSKTSNYLQDKGFDAAAQLTKFRAVKSTGTAQQVTPITGATDEVFGIVQHDVLTAEIARGKGASVRRFGASLMEASEAIAVGQPVSITANGRAQVAGAGERKIGICDEPAGAAGEYIRVTLDLPGTLVA